jgi:carbonic anhydrase/SulP family sulfate permease
LRKIVEKHVGGEVLRIELAHQVSFLNRVAISAALASVPRGGHVVLDARDTDYIDADVLDLIREYENDVAPVRNVQVSLLGFKDHYDHMKDRVQYADFSTRELQARLTPDQVLQILRDGNERFRSGQPLVRDLARQRSATVDDRHPLAIVLSGASSRTPIEMIFDMGLGDIFSARVTGNLASTGVLGSLEYACVLAGAKLILVLGHVNSKVMKMAVDASRQQKAAQTGCRHLDPIIAEVCKSIEPHRVAQWDSMSPADQQAYLNDLYRAHIRRTIDIVLRESQSVRELVDRGQVKLVGGMYDVRTGLVDVFAP